MQRQIKFRMWNKEIKEMYDVGLINFQQRLIFMKHYEGYTQSSFALEDVELMQYTGLHDKNGKEIYEGDIVKILGGEYEQGFYEWDEIVQIKDFIYDGFNLMMDISQIGNQAIEVIGNIWEDSDLLNDSKNTETN